MSNWNNIAEYKCTCHHSENKNMAKVNKTKNVIRKRNLSNLRLQSTGQAKNKAKRIAVGCTNILHNCHKREKPEKNPSFEIISASKRCNNKLLEAFKIHE